MKMGEIEDPITEDEALSILLGILTEEYHHISRGIDNMGNIELSCAKEILQRDCSDIQRNESSEVALTTTKVDIKQQVKPKKNGGMLLNGRCCHCNKRGQQHRDCREKSSSNKENKTQQPDARAFMAV